jgi:hypothetical protein
VLYVLYKLYKCLKLYNCCNSKLPCVKALADPTGSGNVVNIKKDERCRRTPGWNEVPFAIYYVLNNRHNKIN